jgi:hypothetical protein
MAGPLRVMTFNVQLLPVFAGVVEGTVSVPEGLIGLFPKSSADAIARAEAVAADLLAIPAAERPHVIGLNEVFSEDGRAVLVEQLTPVWPHVIESIHQGDLEEDAGLMVFSRLPFRTLPGGRVHKEHFYSEDAGDDSWASKAAVLVQVDTPVDETTLVFTHLQASYLGEDQHRGVRATQLRELADWLHEFFEHDPGKWRSLIVAGDLNVRGDADAATDEWFDVFARPHPFGDRMEDTWIEMRPPKATVDRDPGLTHRDRTTGERSRLDYLCRVTPIDAPHIVAHHARIGHRTVSDHAALEGLFQLRDPHCQPSTATDLGAATPVVGAAGPGQPATSRVFDVTLDITHEGARHWIWIPRPGTYSFHKEPDVAFEVFADSDISTPLERLDNLSVADLPPALQAPYRRRGQRIDPKGATFVSRTPLLVAVRHRQGKAATGPFFVLEHLGDSAATAIVLPPHLDVTAPFPSGQRLGDDDRAWFRVRPEPTLVGKPRGEAVRVTMPAGRPGTLTVLDRGQKEIAGPVTGVDEVEHAFTATVDIDDEDQDFFVRVGRDRDTDVGHVVRWNTPVTFLRLAEGFTIHVNDETGPDWPGADEPELLITIDGDPSPLVSTSWDDADTGEDWPGLTDLIRNAAVKRGWTSPSIAFSEGLGVEIVEPDPPLGMAHGVVTHEIKALSTGEPTPRTRSNAITVFDTISDGTYTVSCTLSRDP